MRLFEELRTRGMDLDVIETSIRRHEVTAPYNGNAIKSVVPFFGIYLR